MISSISTIAVFALTIVAVTCNPVKDYDSTSREHVVVVNPTLNPTVDANGATRTTKTLLGSSVIYPDDSVTTIGPHREGVIVTTHSTDLTTRSSSQIGFAVSTLVPVLIYALF